MSHVYRLTATEDPTCPAGTRLVLVPRPAGGRLLRLLVPEDVSAVVVIVDEDGRPGWIEDSVTGRGIVHYIQDAPE